jgi:pyruvate/2-oxoglutarate dehydrogenase complex dihydrolipoamide dehydrogenase (E3) component
MTSVAIIGGGPGGYEAALVARQLGATVTMIDRDGVGGSCVLTDCVPSKALITTANAVTEAADSKSLGVLVNGQPIEPPALGVDLATVNRRILDLAERQSQDIATRLTAEGVELISGSASFLDAHTVNVNGTRIQADIMLIATGAHPRCLPDAQPDGERILSWEQLYALDATPERLIVVGSGVTGAEFASAYRALGSDVVLISSRDHVLPGEDVDAARVIEQVFNRRGITVLARSRAQAARRTPDGVVVELTNGERVEGSHVLMAVGSIPNTSTLNLAAAGVTTDEAGFITIDRVSRTTAPNIYAAGDCTGVLQLASVAAMQGRIAMWHALGDAVAPLDVRSVSSTVFTNPEIATVGVTQREIEDGHVRGDISILPLTTNPRSKMSAEHDGFVKIMCRRGTRTVAGGVIVSPHASELIHTLTVAIDQRMTVDELASVFTVYPSLSGSVAETARRLHVAAE